jgi:predicted nucleotidyltransferase
MKFPTTQHAKAAELLGGFFEHRDPVDTVLVVNSCARGKATAESDLDMAVLVQAGTTEEQVKRMEAAWQKFASRNPTINQFTALGPWSRIHVDIFDGTFSAAPWDEGGGPDAFEIEIGNRIEHSVPLHAAGKYFRELRAKWLPYYGRDLRTARMKMVRNACAGHVERVAFYFRKGLPFHAFDILWKACQEFLQAVFIRRQTYPIAYNKWIHEQVVEWLELPELYEDLPKVVSVADIESEGILRNAALLSSLLDRWVPRIEEESQEG